MTTNIDLFLGFTQKNNLFKREENFKTKEIYQEKEL